MSETSSCGISIVRISLQVLNMLWLDVFVREQATQHMPGSQELRVNIGQAGQCPCWPGHSPTVPKQENRAGLVMGSRANRQSCGCQKSLQPQIQTNQVKPGSQVSGSGSGSARFVAGHRHTSSKDQGQGPEPKCGSRVKGWVKGHDKASPSSTSQLSSFLRRLLPVYTPVPHQSWLWAQAAKPLELGTGHRACGCTLGTDNFFSNLLKVIVLGIL